MNSLINIRRLTESRFFELSPAGRRPGAPGALLCADRPKS